MRTVEKQEIIDRIVRDKGLSIGDKVTIKVAPPSGSHYLEPSTREQVTIVSFGWSKRRQTPGFVFEFKAD